MDRVIFFNPPFKKYNYFFLCQEYTNKGYSFFYPKIYFQESQKVTLKKKNKKKDFT